MKKTFTLFIAFSSFIFAKAQQPFTPGNLVICKVGTGTSALSNKATPFFLEEHTTTGAIVQSIQLPSNNAALTGSNKVITVSGTATSEGLITRSENGLYLIFTGYNASDTSTGSVVTTVDSIVNRVVGRIDASGIINTTTALKDVSSRNNIRSATSQDGNSFWITSATGGIRYATLGANTSTLISSSPANNRALTIYGGQLYASTASTASSDSGRRFSIYSIGNGLPTTRATVKRSNGIDTNYNGVIPKLVTSPYQFSILSLPSGIVLYIADAGVNATVGHGIQKYSLVDTTWVYNGAIATPAPSNSEILTGLVASANGNSVSLYGTTSKNLLFVNDQTGYNAAPTATYTILDTAIKNTVFRGLAFAPVATPLLPISFRTNLSAALVNSNAKLTWATQIESNTKSFIIEKSTDAKTFTEIAIVSSKGKASEYVYTDPTKIETIQYYRLRILDNEGNGKFSQVVLVNPSLKNAGLSIYPNPVANTATLSHAQAKQGATLKITSINGKVLATYNVQTGATQTSIDVSHFEKASYLLSFQNDGALSTANFVK